MLLTALTLRSYPVYPWYSAAARLEAAGGVGPVMTLGRVGERLQHLSEAAARVTDADADDDEISFSVSAVGETVLESAPAQASQDPPPPPSEAPLAPGREGAREGGIASLLGVLRAAASRAAGACSAPLSRLDAVLVEDFVADDQPVEPFAAPVRQMLLPHAHHGAAASLDAEVTAVSQLHAIAAHTLAAQHGGAEAAALEAELLAHTYVLALLHSGPGAAPACGRLHPWLAAPVHELTELRDVDGLFRELNATALSPLCSARVDAVDFLVRHRRDAAVLALLQPVLDDRSIADDMRAAAEAPPRAAPEAPADGHYASPLPPALAQLHLRVTARVKLLRLRLLEAAAVRRVLSFAETAAQLLSMLHTHALTAEAIAAVASSDVRAYIEDVLLWLPRAPENALLSAPKPASGEHAAPITAAAFAQALPVAVAAAPGLPRALLSRVYTTAPAGGWVDDALVLALVANSHAQQCWRFPSLCQWLDRLAAAAQMTHGSTGPPTGAEGLRVTAPSLSSPVANRMYRVTLRPSSDLRAEKPKRVSGAHLAAELAAGVSKQWWNAILEGATTKDKLASGSGTGAVPFANAPLQASEIPIDTGAVYLEGPGDFAIFQTTTVNGTSEDDEPDALRVIINSQLEGGISGDTLSAIAKHGLPRFIEAVDEVRRLR
jgi:hypothetical protein